MSVKLSNKLRPGNDNQIREVKQLTEYQRKLDFLHSNIIFNINMLNKAKRDLKRLQMNSIVIRLFRQYKANETKMGNKQVIEVKNETDIQVNSSQGTSDDAIHLCDPGFLTFVKTLIKRNDVELSARDVLKTVDRYSCLLLSLKKQQQELLELTREILSYH
ncbi:hypothetical protein WA171_004220, partial [Blastocystis sp. BT1]